MKEGGNTEEKLKNYSLKLSFIVNNFHGGLLMETTERTIEFANAGFCEIFSIPLEPEQLTGFDCRDAARQSKSMFKDPYGFVERINSIVENGKPVYFELLETKDGKFLERDYVPVYDDGCLINHLWIYRDVTRRVKAEKETEKAATEWRTTFDSISDMIAIVDKDWKLMRVNKAFAAVVGKSPKEIIGKYCYEVIHNTNAPAENCPKPEAMQKGKPETFEYFEPNLDINVEATASPIFDRAGEVNGAVLVIRDVTQRNLMQKQLILQDRLASIGELVSGVAHELNNPLTGVMGFSELLSDRDLPPDAREEVQFINKEARKAATIVKNLLTFSREQADDKTDTDVNDILTRIINLRSYYLKTKNINLNMQLSANALPTKGNVSHLHQAFSNIILNAEQAMYETSKKGILTITTQKAGDNVSISIADDGPGIPQNHLDKIFNPFFTTRDVGKGTGLGLSICHGIISEHGGRIYAKNRPERGAEIIVELPLTSS